MSIMEMNNDIFTADYVVFLYSSLCLYLLSGGYRVVRDFWRRQIDKRAAEKISASQSAGTKPEEPLIP